MKKIIHKKANMQEWIEWETRERETEMWGDKITIKPVIAKQQIGDGKQLIYVGTIDQRPNYWLIRIDSNTDVYSSDFDIEPILEILEEEFGRADENDETIFDDINEIYPMVLWSGGHYGSLFNEA